MDWNAIKLFYLDCRSIKATAEHFGVPVNSVRTRYRRENWGGDVQADVQADVQSEHPMLTDAAADVQVEHPSAENGVADVQREHPASGSDVQNGASDVQSEHPKSPGDVQTEHREHRDVQIFAAEVTTYPNAMSPGSPAVDTIASVLEAIQGGQFRSEIEELRRVLGRDGKTAYDRAKTKLPAFCVSGTTADRKRLLKHTGLLQIDFDGLNGTLAAARQKISGDPHVAAAFVSPSGDGLKVLLRIDGSRHDESVRAAAKYFADTYGLKHDPQVKEPTRLCFVSHDPDLLRNAEATVFPIADDASNVAKNGRGRPKKERAWWAVFKGALSTLDLAAIFREAAMLGECLDPDTGKWAVRCPWAAEHGNGGTDWKANASDTVIFAERDFPAFKCLHGHCAERKIEDICTWFEARKPGCVDAHCAERRVWEEGQTNAAGRPRTLLPADDRPDSVFADELGVVLEPKREWFLKSDAVVSVELRRLSEKVRALAFRTIQPVEARTAIEKHVETGFLALERDSGDLVFRSRTMTRECAGGLLAAPQFKERLPVILRILNVSLPIRTESGGIVFPKPGYDPRFHTYTDPNSPELRLMSLDEARQWLLDLHEGFCLKDEQSTTHQIARLFTPFCRGLMGWDARFPVWAFMANRPRSGKDYLAGVTQLLYEGWTCEDAPLGIDSEETRKRITAALVAGRRTMHFANCQGYIQDAVFIGSITSKTFAARALGSTDAKADLILPNELEFSLSANEGLTFRTDLEPRTRKIALEFGEENANGRVFKNPRLHDWVSAHRGQLLSAVGAFVRNWMDAGCPSGPTPFNSYPEWAAVVGGILHAGGLGDPCLPHQDDGLEVGGDREDRAMRALYTLCFEAHPEQWIDKGMVFELVANSDDNDALGWFGSFAESEARGTKTKIGILLRKFRGREMSGVMLEIDASGGRSDHRQLRFARRQATRGYQIADLFNLHRGEVGDVGDVASIRQTADKLIHPSNGTHNYTSMSTPTRANVPNVPNVPTSPTSPVPRLLRGANALREIAGFVSEAGVVALDIETFGARKSDALDPWRGEIRLLSLCVEGHEPWLLDLQATGYDLGPLGPALADAEVIAHNAKFDALWLRVKCGVKLHRVFCTLTAARLLVAGTRPGNDLDRCLERYLGIAPGDDHSTSDWGGMFLTDDQLAYAGRDVRHLHALRGKLMDEISAAALDAVAQLEMQLLPVIVEMEAAGLAVDRAKLDAIRAAGVAESSARAAELRIALNEPALNVSSPQQLQAALQRAGVTVASTNEETLKESGDTRFVPLVLAYRGAEKQAQQAVALIESISKDGRIHGRFEPTGTATGRFSSREPNLQNIGRGPLRECFIAPEGSKLVVADYSQIELRAAAAIASETKMIEAYQRGEDLHRGTAAAVLGKPGEAVTKEDRQLAKAVNFGLLYGQSAPGLVKYAASSYGVALPEDAAKEIRAKFFRTYGQLRQWHGESHLQAEKGVREVRTVLGRRRLIPPEASAWERFTALVNTPVQGGCADGMKRALVQLASALPPSARIVSTVHDEIIVEAPESEGESVRQTVEAVMIEAMAALFPQVPVEVEASVCASWGEK